MSKSKSEKLPSIQFYPGDWRKDPGVQSLSYHDRGVWFEILLLMFESSERGKLLLNGLPMPDDALARLLGLEKRVVTSTLKRLVKLGVATRDPDSGVLICRRMVRDEALRQTRAECGKLGGNPHLVNQKPTTQDNPKPTTGDNQKPTPSSSVSVSPSTTSSFSISSSEEVLEFIPPSLEKVLGFALSSAPVIPKVRAEAWYDDRVKWGWKARKGDKMFLISDWQADLRGYARNWKDLEPERKPSRSTSSSPTSFKINHTQL